MDEKNDQMSPAQPPPYTPSPGYPPQTGYGQPTPYPPGPSQGYSQPMPQPVGQQQATVVVVNPGLGTCPNCRQGVITEGYTCCGICLGVCLFPIGILCCLAMQEKRCSNCNATF